MSDSNDRQRIRRLKWKRRCLLTWLALISAGLGLHFYFMEMHSTFSWLVRTGHPMNDWLSYFEFDHQLLPLFYLALITVLLVFQRKIGGILFLLATVLFTIGGGYVLVEYCSTGSLYSAFSLFWHCVFFAVCLLLSIAILASLVGVDLIDEELKQNEK